MGVNYGAITIVDMTDMGEFSVYPKANHPRSQIYNANEGIYTPDWSNNNLIITPVAFFAGQDVTSNLTSVTWTRRDGIGTAGSLLTGESAIVDSADLNYRGLKVSNNMLNRNSSSGIITYIVTAQYTITSGVVLTATGEIEFTLSKQGESAKNARIIGRNVFKYNSDNELVPEHDRIDLEGQVENTNIVGWYYKNSSGNFVTTGIGNETNIRINPETNQILYGNNYGSSTSVISDLFNNSSAVFKLVTSTNNVYDIFTITKLSDGAKGDSDISAILSNESQMLPADASGHITSYTGATTTLKIFEGGTDVTSGWTITKTYSPSSLSSLDTAVNNNEASFVSTVLTDSTFDTIDVADVTFNCSLQGYANINKKFTITKVKTGQSGTTPTIYSIETDIYAFNKVTEPSTSFVPSSVTFNAYAQTGNVKEAYSGRIQFYNSSGTLIDNTGQAANEDTVNRSSRTFTPQNSWTGTVTAKLFPANTSASGATPLDVQSVGCTSDGTSPVVVVLGNEAEIIPCTSSNYPVSNYTITIPFAGYRGTTRVAVTMSSRPQLFGVTPTYTAASSSSDGSLVYVIPASTQITSMAGTLNLSFTCENKTINKVFSWTRNSAAVNSVILQLLTPDGIVFNNGSGTLYVQGILQDGNDEATGDTYTWYQYKNNEYKLVNTTNTPGVVTGHGTKNSSTGVWTWNNGANGSSDTTSDMIKIDATAVDGYASFKVEVLYGSKTYVHYVSVIDKTDPLQVSVHSTVGTQILNGQGNGAIYVIATQDGVIVDYVPINVRTGTIEPNSGNNNGDYFILLNTSLKTATLKIYNNGWTTNGIPSRKCSYTWTWRDKDGNPVTTYTIGSTQYNYPTSGQIIYIDGDMINGKVTADVTVTLN